MLNNICDQFKPVRGPCKGIVEKHLGNLISELMTNDGPKAACIKIHACKKTLLPNKMLRSIVLITLLITSVCALHLEMHKVKSTGNELEDIGETPAEQLPGVCWACKWTMKKLRGQITSSSTKNDIKNMLGMVCDEIGFLKYLCKTFVNKFMDVLIEELSTTDNARTICVNVGVC
ncbi:antimicrobial peptide NK-lysin-like protein [Labeo rohita]|uniref:Antimicrobial peptide NK-lysin-like protein n=1 Tax=Labeo rohita TaxID=84645 RepID=A0A498LZ51_LABRO|nr:antimicrobial peptide NK-lysin-like protein [Labeo rohita]